MSKAKTQQPPPDDKPAADLNGNPMEQKAAATAPTADAAMAAAAAHVAGDDFADAPPFDPVSPIAHITGEDKNFPGARYCQNGFYYTSNGRPVGRVPLPPREPSPSAAHLPPLPDYEALMRLSREQITVLFWQHRGDVPKTHLTQHQIAASLSPPPQAVEVAVGAGASGKMTLGGGQPVTGKGPQPAATAEH